LNLKAIGIKNVSEIDFIDKPPKTAFISAFKTLMELGALNSETGDLSKLGKEMSVLPTEPIYSKLLIVSRNAEGVIDSS